MGSLLVLFLSGVVVILGTIRSCPAIARFADAEGFDLAEALMPVACGQPVVAAGMERRYAICWCGRAAANLWEASGPENRSYTLLNLRV